MVVAISKKPAKIGMFLNAFGCAWSGPLPAIVTSVATVEPPSYVITAITERGVRVEVPFPVYVYDHLGDAERKQVRTGSSYWCEWPPEYVPSCGYVQTDGPANI